MRLYLQWTLSSPQPWVGINLDTSPQLRRIWEGLPQKVVPIGGEIIDNSPGWIYDIYIQGLVHRGYDHYAVLPRSDGLDVVTWNDDPADFPIGEKFGCVYHYMPMVSEAAGTNFTRTYYAEPAKLARLMESANKAANTTVLPWALFPTPPVAVTRHGIWVSDSLHQAHVLAQRSYPPATEWVL